MADAGPGAEERFFETEDGVRLSSVWVPATDEKGAILHCHGNAGNLASRLPMARAWAEQGYSMLLFDYRGYGHSAGAPHERGLLLDARAAWRELLALATGPALVAGRSLGCIPAIALGLEGAPQALLLDSPPQSAREMARLLIPFPGIHLLLQMKFDNARTVAEVCCPVWIQHGDEDREVPFDHGRWVFDSAPEPKEFLPLLGMGHNDDRGVAVLMAQCAFLETHLTAASREEAAADHREPG